jgi:hypothetical protein
VPCSVSSAKKRLTAGLRTQHSSSNHCFPRVQGLGHRPAHQGNGDHATQHWPYDPPAEELGILRTDHPHYYKGRLPGESEADFVARIVANLEALILREGPDTIAAFLAEPITGASGVIVPPDGYYTRVQELLRRYDIAFWAYVPTRLSAVSATVTPTRAILLAAQWH